MNVNKKINPNLLNNPWDSKWIAYPKLKHDEYGVYLYRKTININIVLDEFIIHISADNRYKLHVNGKYICNGPACSYLERWNFDTIDISKFLRSGINTITVVVWNFSINRPLSQISGRTGLIIQGNSEYENLVNTDKSWVVFKDEAYKPITFDLKEYYVAGAGEEFTSEKHPWAWMEVDFDTTSWANALEVEIGKPIGCNAQYGTPSIHFLSPREIPFMQETFQRLGNIRRTTLNAFDNEFLDGNNPVNVPAMSSAKFIIDTNVITTAYLVVLFSSGKNSSIKITYAESLFDCNGEKKHRDEIINKEIAGNYDKIYCDGGVLRKYQTLYWRTFRYIEIDIQTSSEPLILNDIFSYLSLYPFQETASFESDNNYLNSIWQIGWRTQRLCSNETFMDTPYYERFQYIGDSRIQALVSTYVSGDNRLTRKAISTLRASMLSPGILQSRFPSSQIQIIPPFSLVWITMVYDYWMLNDDTDFIFSMIPDMIKILNWFKERINSFDMIGPVEWWNFVDWVNSSGWENGSPPEVYSGSSSILSLQYVYTLQKSSEIFKYFGFNDLNNYYLSLASKIKNAVFKNCFDSNKGLIADSLNKKEFSQHCNIFALLTDTFSESISRNEVINKIITDEGLAQATLYFKYYLFEAIEKSDRGDLFIRLLKPWEDMISMGLSTFSETSEPTRSDCHAWSASPIYFFLSLIAGIKPNSPGFKTIKVQPNFNNLKYIKAKILHRDGLIMLDLKIEKDNSIVGDVILPDNLNGVFIYKNVEKILIGGLNKIN